MSVSVRYKNLSFLGYPKYLMGSDGSVWSRKKSTRWKRLKGRKDSKGYVQVVLSDGECPRAFYVHQLVLLAFVGPCPEGMEACHYPDREPTNNKASNLRWDSPSGNVIDSVIHGTRVDNRGENNPACKLLVQDVIEIRRLWKEGKHTAKVLALMFGVSVIAIRFIYRRRTWKHV